MALRSGVAVTAAVAVALIASCSSARSPPTEDLQLFPQTKDNVPPHIMASNTSVDGSELLGVLTLTVEGLTAPKADAKRICPKSSHTFGLYDVPTAELTVQGMNHMAQLGSHLREEYVTERGLLSPQFGQSSTHSSFDAYFRSSWQSRFIQGAVAMGYGLYPPVLLADGMRFSTAIPVFAQLEKTEHELSSIHGPCKRVKKKDFKKYSHQRAPDLLWSHRKLLGKISKLCGVDFTDYSHASGGIDQVGSIIDLAEMLRTDHAHGFPMLPGLTQAMYDELQHLAFQAMVERSLSSSHRVTYWLGGFLDAFENNLLAMQPVEAKFPKGGYNLYSYHASHEVALALQKLLQWPLRQNSFPYALGLQFLPPSATLLFEIHRNVSGQSSAQATNDYFVRTFLWTPELGRQSVHLGVCAELDCPWDTIQGTITAHTSRTGRWTDVCNFHVINVPLKKSSLTASLEMAWMNIDTLLFGFGLFVALGFAVVSTFRRIERHRLSRRSTVSSSTPLLRPRRHNE